MGVLVGMREPRYPSLYEINTRVWLTELGRRGGRGATLDDIADGDLDRWAGLGFTWLWWLSVWEIGQAGQRVSRSEPAWRREFQETLPDLTEEDIPGSGFAITGYRVQPGLGGDEALARLRARMRQRGLKLMLDFVPNHTGLDHPWVEEHPEYYIRGTEQDLARAPQNYTRIQRRGGDLVLAYGRDPYFAGWPDTLQLDYSNPDVAEAMAGELAKVAALCDGVRCDMAMLVLPDVFERTWGLRANPFWPEATRRVREQVPGFLLLAEVYWDLEWTMHQQGFDYAYDKRLYDRLRAGHARPVREHLHAGLDYQNKLARFMENHDEPRAAAAFPDGPHQAAAVVTFLAPGLRFFHQGQFEGRLKRVSPHLGRAPSEEVNPVLRLFYERLLEVLRRSPVRRGHWRLLECLPAWDGNGSCHAFIAFAWEEPGARSLLAVVNFADHPSQCYLPLPFLDPHPGEWRLRDLWGEAHYVRRAADLHARGLYLALAPWQYHVFELQSGPPARSSTSSTLTP